MSLETTFRIVLLKAKAKRLYLGIRRRSDLPCGAHLTDYIRPDVPAMIREFNETMAELATLDPEAKATIEREGRLQ